MFVPFTFLAFWSFSKADKAGIGKTMLTLLALFALGCLIAWGTEVVQGKLPKAVSSKIRSIVVKNS